MNELMDYLEVLLNKGSVRRLVWERKYFYEFDSWLNHKVWDN